MNTTIIWCVHRGSLDTLNSPLIGTLYKWTYQLNLVWWALLSHHIPPKNPLFKVYCSTCTCSKCFGDFWFLISKLPLFYWGWERRRKLPWKKSHGVSLKIEELSLINYLHFKFFFSRANNFKTKNNPVHLWIQ